MNDPSIVLPAPGTPTDPTVNGATLVLLNPHTGERDTYVLPVGYWHRIGRTLQYKRTRADSYANVRNGDEMPGPCTKVKLRAGQLLARCAGRTSDAMFLSLDEVGGQGALAAMLALGAGDDTVQYCAVFGGTILRDEDWRFGSWARFIALNAPRPAQCPALP